MCITLQARSAIRGRARRGLRYGALALAGALLSSVLAAEPPGRLDKVRLSADGRSFQTASGAPFVPLGVNYFRPGTGWAPQVWKKFDAEATRGDFQRMKAMGVRCVRVFLTYGSFYLEAGKLEAEGLARFDQFLALAEEAGIYVHPTGPDHWEGLPAWARGDRIADDTVLSALESFWKLFAARYRGRPVLFAYDLLNEPSVGWGTAPMRPKWNRWLEQRYGSLEKVQAAWGRTNTMDPWGDLPPPKPAEAPRSRELLDYQLFREQLADDWTRRQAAAIKAADPDALVTVGLIQWSVPALLPGVQHYSAFRPERQAPLLDFLEIHFYPLARGAYEYRTAEDEAQNLAYLESVVREVARPGKAVVVAEFGWYGGGKPTFDGGRHPAATEEQQAQWCRRAVETTEGLAVGWLNWGLYDHPEARDCTELTGLLTSTGQTKAWGRAFAVVAQRLRGRSLVPPKLGPRPTLDWDLALTSPKAAGEFRAEYLEAFRADVARKPEGKDQPEPTP
jgi:hypothetical protein